MNRKSILFSLLGGFFITNAIIAEVIGGKFILVWGQEDTRVGFLGPFVMSVGIFPWPIVFITTDLVNEYFGKRGVRRLTWLTVLMIAWAFVILGITQIPPAVSFSPISSAAFNTVFGQSLYIMVGSITAFLVAQLIDVFVFHYCRQRTGRALIWLRATGSTVVSQFIDTVVVMFVGIKCARWDEWPWDRFWSTVATGYSAKVVIAILITPLIYLAHRAVQWYLGPAEAEAIADLAARDTADDPLLPGQ